MLHGELVAKRLFDRLVDEWSGQACGLTFDLVGSSKPNSEVQWVLAFPVQSDGLDAQLQATETLRTDLLDVGYQDAPMHDFDESAQLPNGVSLEDNCPYRPSTCLGSHIVVTGHGFVQP